ncbi:SdpI family protein [Gordonia otitidis]|uniref:SdpI family protein n=1 Tax=Gordonia otitidis TaxID=249058 RepID=UPI001D13348F|nr:SdpI family protein [Gordonia otitidis]UEA61028.1 SdpI family protein [Gordonia otitidis]
MHVVSIVVSVCVCALALVWLIVGATGLVGRLPRNRYFGVRTDSTMASPEAFALANRIAAPGTLGAAVILIAGGALTLAVDSAWSVVFGLIALLAGILLVGAVSGYAVRAADAVAPADDAGCNCCSSDHGASDHSHEAPTPAESGSDPAADCGTDSCASCTLRGMCSTDDTSAHSDRRAPTS